MNPKHLLLSMMLSTALILCFHQATWACGYAYVSDCATTLDMEVNGATSTFQVSNCPYLAVFHNHNFGQVTSLSLAKAKSQTWESCDNRVMNARLYYRVYAQSATPGAFNNSVLPQLSTITNGPYRTKTREGSPGVNLLAGLNPGSYFIEIYFESDVDTNNDNAADDTIEKDNNGNYYRAAFTILAGQGGSLTVTLVNKSNVTCHGGNDGSFTVTTSGGKSPYSYSWLGGATGPTVTNLAAGAYTVTSTDVDGNTGILNVIITQPTAIFPGFSSTNETSSAANNGTASVSPSGGTAPYSILWSNNATTASITNLDSGTYGVTITDANGCTATGQVTIIVSGTIPTNYCSSKGDFPWVDWITRVQLNTLDNASGKNQYTNFTTLSTELNTGTTYTITLENGFSWQTFDEYWKVWIDYNRNGIFEEPGEIAFSGILAAPPLGSPGGSKTGTITVPVTAEEGSTRMRVALKRGAYPTPCETIPFGEVEDYLVQIVNSGPVACHITAQTSNVQCSDNETNADPDDDTFTFDLMVTGNGTGTSWIANIGGTSYTGSYGVVKNIGPFPIAGGPIDFIVTDVTDETCTATNNIMPPTPCSFPNPCTVNATFTTPICDNNNTPADPSDDTFTFSMTVTGTNNGSGWTASILGANQSGNYNTPIPMVPFPISAGNLSFTVKDSDNPTCEEVVAITPPSTCSQGSGSVAYCPATSDFPWHDWIAGVSLSEFANPSGKQAYSNFTALTANITAGDTHPISLTAGFSWYTYEEYWKVWIDYNHDGIFQEPSETAYSFTQAAPPNGTLEATVNGNIQIPLDALPGTTRMRVAMKRGSAPGPCETLPNGEVEDYTVNISAQLGDGNEERSLSIQLIAETDLEQVNLWGAIKTAENASSWRLEKSADGLTFEALASGMLEETGHYLVIQEQDEAPFTGNNFYRLMLLDDAGNILSMTAATVIFQPIAHFSVFPNPASNEFQIEISALVDKEVTVLVYNQMGQPVYRQRLPVGSGHLHRVVASDWEEGLYMVELLPTGYRPITKRLFIGRP